MESENEDRHRYDRHVITCTWCMQQWGCVRCGRLAKENAQGANEEDAAPSSSRSCPAHASLLLTRQKVRETMPNQVHKTYQSLYQIIRNLAVYFV